MKKSVSIILVLYLCTSLCLLTACSNSTSKNTDNAMGLLKKSSDYYNKVKNMTIDSTIESCYIYNDMFTGEPVICGTTAKANSIVYNNPLKFKSEILFKYDDTVEDGGISYTIDNNTKMSQYGILEEEIMSIYQTSENGWIKFNLSNEEFVLNDTLGLNYVSNYDKFVTEGTIVGKEKIGERDAIKAQFTLIEDYTKIMFKKYGFEEFAKLVDSANTDKAIIDMMKDTAFTIWFDEKSDEIIKIELDLTSLMKTLRKLVIDDNKEHLSDERYAYLNQCADKISIKNTIKFTDVDNSENFELPQEAKEAKVYGQE